MQYEEALRLWGARKLRECWGYTTRDVDIDLSTIKVEMEFDAGYACCGGRDPGCYCSLAESPSANVTISGYDSLRGVVVSTEISSYDFDFVRILKEILEAGNGELTQ